jgi:hypothetical protein
MSHPSDPRDTRIEALEEKVRELQLHYEMQFGNEKVSGAIVSLLTSMSSDIKDVKMALFGNPQEPESIGLLVRLDRMEQWSAQAKWVLGSIATSVIAELAWLVFHH